MASKGALRVSLITLTRALTDGYETAVLEHLRNGEFGDDVVESLAAIVAVVEHSMDGTSGALYAIFLNALLGALQTQDPGKITPAIWASSLRQSCEALSQYTPAKPGDRTLVDALYPFVDVLDETGDVKKAAEAAKVAAEETKKMKASLGRTVYIGSLQEDVPDPGAWGLACFFLGLAGVKPTEEGWESI